MLSPITGSTRVAAVIGDPVEHSLSPALHNAAFSSAGLDWVYVALPVLRGQGRQAVEAMRVMGLAGLSVTMPHKADVVAGLDSLGPVATRLQVVNTICWGPGGDELHGESTDGAGFLASLREDDGFDPAGQRCVILGGGGAARAVTESLAAAGAASITVVARRIEAAAACCELVPATVEAVGAAPEDVAAAIAGADLLVNATPVGMNQGDGLPFGLEPAALGGAVFVADLIYQPAVTPLIAAARSRGARAVNGLGMLIHQAGKQFEIWTGQPAPLTAMSAAALAVLGHREH